MDIDPSKNDLSGASFAKHLASCDKSTRNQAVRLLRTWLMAQQSVSDEEMQKIWKGLFYCVWHADKQQAQLDLINRLASLLVSLDLSLSIQFFEVFLITMRREWSGIDFLRLDKFYLLLRRFLHHFFLLLKNNFWEIELLTRLMGILREKTLLAADKYQAEGVNYHLAETFLTEVKGFLPLNSEIIDVLLKPFCCVLEKSPDKVLVHKIKVNVIESLLENGRKLLMLKETGDSADSSEDVEKFGKIALTAGLSTKFFDSASSLGALQGNRKVLFGLHEDFLKLESASVKMGVKILTLPVKGPEISEISKDGTQCEMDNSVDEQVSHDSVREVCDSVSISTGTVQEDAETADQSTDILHKKTKKGRSKKKSVGMGKKSKTKKNLSDCIGFGIISTVKGKDNDASAVANQNNIANGDNSSAEVNENLADACNSITFDKSVISNLQKQFETVAAEAGMDMDISSMHNIPTSLINTGLRKRKRMKNINWQLQHGSDLSIQSVDGSAADKSGEKIAKRVRFSMKNNLIWKPHSPLPPQSLRLPPLATPRGSALKKGIPPGPIRLVKESPMPKRVKKRANMLKKKRKNSKSVSPAIKRLRKLQANSV